MKVVQLKYLSWWAYLLPIGLGLGVFSATVGLKALFPSNVGWISGVDPLEHYLGWQLFRQSPWTFPIGLSPHNGIDLSSSIVYSDAITLLAFLFKPFSVWLPEQFQYFGIWALLCCVMQAIFSWLLLGLITQRISLRLLGAILLTLAPPMLWRIGLHNALAGHFVILAALYLVLRPRTRLLKSWLALLGITALIGPYLLAIALILFLVSRWQLYFSQNQNRTLDLKVPILTGRWKRCAIDVGIVGIPLILVLWQAGYFALGSGKSMAVTDGMYGAYGANLAGLFYAHGWSYINPLMLSHQDAYESFFYLGMGTICLIPFALLKIRLLSSNLLRRYAPLLLTCIGLTLFAISHHVGFGPWTFHFPLPEKVVQVASILRASARLFWPVYYLIIVSLLYLIIRGYSTKSAKLILGLACLIQLLDTSAGYLVMRARFERTALLPFTSPLQDAFWQNAGKQYRQVVRIPAGNSLVGWDIFASYATQYQLATNSIFLSRIDEAKVVRSNERFQAMLDTGNFEPHTLYMLQSNQVQKALTHLRSDDLLARIDNFNVLAPGWLNCSTCPAVSKNQIISPKVLAPSLQEQINFNQAGFGQYYLEPGQWAAPEVWGVWALGDGAKLAIRKPKVVPVRTLTLSARALVNSSHPEQILQVTVDGHILPRLILKEAEYNQIIIPVNSNLQSDTVSIEFKFLTPKKPSDLGMGSDDRALAFGLQSAVFH